MCNVMFTKNFHLYFMVLFKSLNRFRIQTQKILFVFKFKNFTAFLINKLNLYNNTLQILTFVYK